jgi:hypothetical protein
MKKEKKVKLYFTEDGAKKIKSLATDNKIKFWNDWNHFQFDAATAILTVVGIIVVVGIIAALGI